MTKNKKQFKFTSTQAYDPTKVFTAAYNKDDNQFKVTWEDENEDVYGWDEMNFYINKGVFILTEVTKYIKVLYTRENNWHTFTSTDVPGLYITSTNFYKSFNDVSNAIESLTLLNDNKKVKAIPSTGILTTLEKILNGGVVFNWEVTEEVTSNEAAEALAILKNENDTRGLTQLLPGTFTFKTEHGEELCTAQRKADNYFDVSWAGNHKTYSEKELQSKLDSGEYWMVDYAEGAKSCHHPETVVDEACEVCLGVEEEFEETPSLLDTIKSFTEASGIDVIISKGKFIVYFYGTEYHADDEMKLADIFTAITTLEMNKTKNEF